MNENGTLRSLEIKALGIHTEQLRRWLSDGKIQRVSRGLYHLPQTDLGEHRSLIEICTATPNAVVCLLSALRFHGVTTQNPSATWIALPKGQRSPRRNDLDLRVIHLSSEHHSTEIETHKLDGGTISVYSLERTLVDCFRFRNAVGLDVFLDAMKECLPTRRVSMDRIYTVATSLRAASSIRPYLEAL
ncbi:MAG: type IV toxin-antitoxin system AbiEi family antitoxin domain-containing protein [Fibrobacteres bacterium]|nr:type IV toxin-antitoxin system AbiEi family antitoxin domain-containing protein [Fibrobacterota bacterium]